MEDGRWRKVTGIFEAACAIEPAGRAAYLSEACGGEDAVRVEVESLLAAHEAAGAFLETPALATDAAVLADALPDPRIGRRFGPFRLVREIARGGMGDVYEAVRDDGQYEQRVAVKLLRMGFDAEFARRRFRAERQILAGLNHPNIARLLDGGAGPDGQPYLVMERIEGLPLLEHCARRGLGVRERIRLFLRVAAAVAFAHQRLIVHRDLKPANILVTAEGQPKLLDFGIARVLEAGAGPSGEATALLLTPAYASPEQARGEAIGTASDVYSLGMILFELLVGERPYTVDGVAAAEALRRISETPAPKPSAVARRRGDERLARTLAGDLDTIVLMALRKEPERRYASVERLAGDLERYLGDRPVRARRDTASYRAAKFFRRHRGSVAAAAAIVALLVGGVAATLWQARRAERERAIAERRFDDVKKLAATMMFDVHDAIRDLPGATHARQLLVSASLDYLNRLSREAAGDTALESELAAAYERVGDVQGNPVFASLGDTAGAERSYRAALRIREALGQAFEEARDHHRLGLCANARGDLTTAASEMRKAVELDARGSGPEAQSALATDERMFGYLLAETGHYADGLDAARRAVDGFERLEASRGPLAAQASRLLPGAYGTLAFIAWLSGDLQGAVATQTEAEGLMRRASLAEPQSAALAEGHAEALYYISEWRAEAGDERAAWAGFDEGRAIFERLASSDPKDTLTPRMAAFCLGGAGEASVRLGHATAGLAMLRRARAEFERLAAVSPGNYYVASGLADTDERLGRAYSFLGARSAARRFFDASLARWLDMRRRGALARSDAMKPIRLRAEISAASR